MAWSTVKCSFPEKLVVIYQVTTARMSTFLVRIGLLLGTERLFVISAHLQYVTNSEELQKTK